MWDCDELSSCPRLPEIDATQILSVLLDVDVVDSTSRAEFDGSKNSALTRWRRQRGVARANEPRKRPAYPKMKLASTHTLEPTKATRRARPNTSEP